MSVTIKKEDSPSSDSEVIPSSSRFDPMQALYSDKVVVPVRNAPMYETVRQFEDAQKNKEILAVGESELVRKREQEKETKRLEKEKLVEEKNRQRFAQYRDLLPERRQRRVVNVLTRIDRTIGPLSALKDCVDNRLRLKIVTRNATGIRGELHATLVAFDKQWNLALCDVLEVWRRKAVKKRKIPPCLGTPVAKGTAAKTSPVPIVTETPLGGGVWECTRHIPQMLVRGEHVVLVNIVER
ncbi:U7 snRNA-associated Sm-like protein LSm11 [Plodia interpunctella]|uniref:U7 snRNA-associated Sm-like protein LSm11 n=1 Tax=Plodia interpunctella TaxID=58824 RepID=UPI002367C092|nr:U7 snRNA-associated Sm-like protein LSm11 [Plodia interpunctella]